MLFQDGLQRFPDDGSSGAAVPATNLGWGTPWWNRQTELSERGPASTPVGVTCGAVPGRLIEGCYCSCEYSETCCLFFVHTPFGPSAH